MAYRKVFIVWNPASGGKSRKIIPILTDYLKSEDVNYQLFDTELSKNATITVEQNLDASFTDIIVVGGDGTLNESVNGLKYSIPLAIIPAGTGDDFIKMVAIGKNLKEQMETALYGNVHSIDLGLCNERKFINGVGIGFDGQIVEDMLTKRVPFLTGHAAYYYHVLRILWGYQEKPFKFFMNEISYHKDLILLTIANGSTFGGGFKLAPNAKIDDGLLSICEIGRFKNYKRFLNVHKLSNGTHGNLPRINFYETKEISIESNPLLFAHIDGERLGNPPFKISVLPKALKLRVLN